MCMVTSKTTWGEIFSKINHPNDDGFCDIDIATIREDAVVEVALHTNGCWSVVYTDHAEVNDGTVPCYELYIQKDDTGHWYWRSRYMGVAEAVA